MRNRRQHKKHLRKTLRPFEFLVLYNKYWRELHASTSDREGKFYILEGETFRAATRAEWSWSHRNFEKCNRLASEHFACEKIWVSTVFLGTDHNITVRGSPILFETMIFVYAPELEDHAIDGYQERYHTYEAAMTGHRIACEMAQAAMKETCI